MALTRSFKDLVQKRVTGDPAFAEALLREEVDTLLNGEVDAGKSLLHGYMSATVGFKELGKATETEPKSLARIFSLHGSSQVRSPSRIIRYLWRQAGFALHTTVRAGQSNKGSSG